jgi:uncharacterized protein (DUF1330 family)
MANIRIEDEAIYQKYIERAGEIFSKYNGSYMAVDNNPTILEGTWDYTRAVLIRFDSRKDFENWYHSAGYQEILKFRLSAAVCDTILIQADHE